MVNPIEREKKIAKKIVKKYSLSPPVDVLKILKNYADYVEDYIPNNVDAVCIMNIEKPLVILNRFQHPNRKRFTLAHELGHLLIPWHYGMISCHTGSEDNINGDRYHKMENEANSFAAELLMPSSWLSQIVADSEECELAELLVAVSNKAEVSTTAAFFSLFNHLPSGYIAFVKNNNRPYGRVLKSSQTNIFIPKQDDITDFNWLDSCAVESDKFETDSLTIHWWRIKGEVSIDQLNKLIKAPERADLNHLFNIINSYGEGAFALAFQSLINLLPPGYLVLIKGGNYKRVFSSPETRVNIPAQHEERTDIAWIKRYSDVNGQFSYNGYNYYWGNFVVNTPRLLETSDSRLSKEILRDILNDCYSSSEEKITYTRKINGVVGALNNVAPREFNDFYRMFKERFIGSQIYRKIATHEDFDLFVIRKIKELLDRKK